MMIGTDASTELSCSICLGMSVTYYVRATDFQLCSVAAHISGHKTISRLIKIRVLLFFSYTSSRFCSDFTYASVSFKPFLTSEPKEPYFMISVTVVDIEAGSRR